MCPIYLIIFSSFFCNSMSQRGMTSFYSYNIITLSFHFAFRGVSISCDILYFLVHKFQKFSSFPLKLHVPSKTAIKDGEEGVILIINSPFSQCIKHIVLDSLSYEEYAFKLLISPFNKIKYM